MNLGGLRRRLISLLTISLVVVSTLAAGQEAKVRLLVDPVVTCPRLIEMPKDYHDGAVYMTVAARLYVENYGTTSVTVPTRISPYFKSTSGTIIRGPDGESRTVDYSFRYQDDWHGKKVQPSASAFEPVTLQPGELTQVGLWKPEGLFLDTLPGDLSNVTFVYEVAGDLASRFGWWSGKLEVRCSFSEQLKAPRHAQPPAPEKRG